MTKRQVTSAPIITADTLAWLKALCDVPVSVNDTDKQLRWKAAQRDIYLKAKHFHELGMAPENKSRDTAAKYGITVKHED